MGLPPRLDLLAALAMAAIFIPVQGAQMIFTACVGECVLGPGFPKIVLCSSGPTKEAHPLN